MPEIGFIAIGVFLGAPVGMLGLALLSLPHLNRVEEENDRLRRLVATATEDVAK